MASKTQNNLGGVSRDVCEFFAGLQGLSLWKESSWTLLCTTTIALKSKLTMFILFPLLCAYNVRTSYCFFFPENTVATSCNTYIHTYIYIYIYIIDQARGQDTVYIFLTKREGRIGRISA